MICSSFSGNDMQDNVASALWRIQLTAEINLLPLATIMYFSSAFAASMGQDSMWDKSLFGAVVKRIYGRFLYRFTFQFQKRCRWFTN